MNGNKAHSEIPDFRREDDIWVRTPEEKGPAFLERFLRQTDQKNEEERCALVGRLQHYYEDDLNLPTSDIKAETLSRIVAQSTDQTQRLDLMPYSDI